MTKLEQFNFLLDNISKLSHRNQNLKKDGFNKAQRLCITLNEINITVPIYERYEDIRKYFTDEDGICIICGKDSTLSNNNLRLGFRKCCSKTCFYKDISNRQKSDNTIHRVKDKKRWSEMVSKRMKLAIAEGRFTPNVTNSWCNSRIPVCINSKIINVRSSWEAYFLLKNPNFYYEKTRIPYIDNKGVSRNYIVDFTDKFGNLYEIKPSSKVGENSEKVNAAKKYAKQNKIDFNLITEDILIDIDLTLLNNQPSKELLLKRLKRYENKKNN